MMEIDWDQQNENDAQLIELNWAQEAEARIDAYNAGLLDCIPIEDVFAEIENDMRRFSN